MSCFGKPTLSLFAALLVCGTTTAHAGPVVDYLTEAARRTWAEEERETSGDPAVALPPKTVKQLFKGAERIQQKDVPSILRPYFTNTKYPNQNFWRLKEADGAQVFFAQPATHPTFLAPHLYVQGRGENGVAVGHSAYTYGGKRAPAFNHTTLVTLPKHTSRLWSTLDDWTVRALKTTREKLHGRPSSAKNTLANLLGHTNEWLSDRKKDQKVLKAVQEIVKKSQRISATQVPSFLQGYFGISNTNSKAYFQPYANLKPYYIYREKDRKYYISMEDELKTSTIPAASFRCDAYDHVGLWHYDKLRIAAMPRGKGTSLGKRLSTKTLVALGVTRDDFGAPRARSAARKSGSAKPRAPAASKPLAAKTPPAFQTQKKR